MYCHRHPPIKTWSTKSANGSASAAGDNIRTFEINCVMSICQKITAQMASVNATFTKIMI
jgi:hypothetical protein